jgi:hypothetical protein
MNDHLDGERLLGFVDGALDARAAAAVAAHLANCADCQRRFDDHCEFDAAVAKAPDWTAELRQRTQAATLSALRGQAPAARARRWPSPLVLPLAAAALLAGAALWAFPGERCRVDLHVDTMPGPVRAAAERRLHLDIAVDAPRWLVVFGRDASGKAQRLFPHPDPTLDLLGVTQPLPAKQAVRVPSADLFDFALDAKQPWVELVVIFGERAFDGAQLAQLASGLATAPLGAVPAAIVDRHPLARRVAVPIE